MHDLVRDMGREIAHMESPRDSGKRSRLFNPQKVCDVLQGNKGSENVEVLVVERQALKDVNLSTKAFQKMINLRVLIIDGELHIGGDFELLSKELRWLSWKECPLKCIPSNFPAERLVVLNMQGSNIQEFGLNLQYCRNLKNLDLSYCKRLRSTPNFSGSRSLETLRLNNCSSLKKIHPSIGSLDRLTSLLFDGCKKITDLPSSICQLKSLEYLDIRDCLSLQTLPDDIGDMQSLIYLFAFDTGIKQFPRSIEMLINVEELQVGSNYLGANGIFSRRRLHRIESLPIYISELYLTYCDLSEADILMDIGSLSYLTILDLSGNSFLHLPFDFSELTLLMYLDLTDCENLETLPSVSNLENLKGLDLLNCEKLVKITGLEKLHSVRKINMLNCTSLQNPFNEGFFSAQALSYPSRIDQKDKLILFVECNEIPDWCSNKVTAPSICLTMHTVHNNEYKLLGMVLWFVIDSLDFFRPCNVHFYVTVADKKHSVFEWSSDTIIISRSGGKESRVYYICCLQKPFDGLKMKVGGKIAVKEDAGKGIVKKIGIHLLYLDQHGNVTSLPAIVDHSSTHYLQRLTAEHIDDNNNIPIELL